MPSVADFVATLQTLWPITAGVMIGFATGYGVRSIGLAIERREFQAKVQATTQEVERARAKTWVHREHADEIRRLEESWSRKLADEADRQRWDLARSYSADAYIADAIQVAIREAEQTAEEAVAAMKTANVAASQAQAAQHAYAAQAHQQAQAAHDAERRRRNATAVAERRRRKLARLTGSVP
jgi:hypothetical protein